MDERGNDSSYASVTKGKSSDLPIMEKETVIVSPSNPEPQTRSWASLFVGRDEDSTNQPLEESVKRYMDSNGTIANVGMPPENSNISNDAKPNQVDQNWKYTGNYVPNPYMIQASNAFGYTSETQFSPYSSLPVYHYQPALFSVPPPTMQYTSGAGPAMKPVPQAYVQQTSTAYQYYPQTGNMYCNNPYMTQSYSNYSPMQYGYSQNYTNGYVHSSSQNHMPMTTAPEKKVPKKEMDSWNNAVAVMERERIIKEKIGLLINNRYRIVQKINVGSYGAIYTALVISDPAHSLVAVKFETASVEDSHLRYEHDVYKVCHDGPRSKKNKSTEGFAKVLWIGEEYQYKIMVMELLGPSLENLFTYCSYRFRKETVYELGMQMLERVEHLHSRGFIHRDLKPENFLMGLGYRETVCYLIDFGLARRYRFRDGADLSHVPFRKGKNLVGTAKYASLNSHYGLELSRRDDLESLGYILLEFMVGELPWKETRNRARYRTKQQSYNRIKTGKEQLDWDATCPALAEWIRYARGMEFTEKPDYDRFREYLRQYIIQSDDVSIPNIELSNMSLRDREELKFGADSSVDLRKNIALFNTTEKNASRAIDVLPELVANKTENLRFEWLERRESSASEKYTYDCLYRWTLPYGEAPTLPPDYQSSMSFGYGIGEGGFA